jgi:DNA helicase II / ATP-dependent DNA helicase PcrA
MRTRTRASSPSASMCAPLLRVSRSRVAPSSRPVTRSVSPRCTDRRGFSGPWSFSPASPRGAFRRHRALRHSGRLFYVAVTRAQKFLFVSWARGKGGRNSAPSPYFNAFASHPGVEPTDVSLRARARSEPAPKSGVTDVRLTFSEIKPVLDCAYRFKLTGVYGFRAPFEEAQGFGKALHDALAEVHRRALEGDLVTPDDVPHLVRRHVHLPFASQETGARLREHAHGILSRYLARHGDRLDEVELVEKPIEVQLGDGITVEGRIDLVYRRADDEVAIVDFKSDKRAQAEEMTDAQLRLYSLGYEALTGRRPERTEVWELDTLREHARAVNDEVLDAVRAQVVEVARRVRTGDLSASPEASRCSTCSARSVCGSRVEVEGDASP